MKISTLLLPILSVLALAACSDKGSDLSALTKLKERACACEDSKCATAVMKELKGLKELRGNKDAAPIVKQLTACVSDAMVPKG